MQRQSLLLIGPNTIVLMAMNGVPWWFFQRSDHTVAPRCEHRPTVRLPPVSRVG